MVHVTYVQVLNIQVLFIIYVFIVLRFKKSSMRGNQMKTEHPLQSDNGICFIQK